jgi:type I restriction enzyme S subunit
MADGLNPYPAYKASGVPWLGDVPAHWTVSRLKQVCRLMYGDSLSAEQRIPGTVPVYGSNGVVGNHQASNTLGPCIVIGRKGSFGKVNYSAKPVFAIDTTFFIDQRFTQHDLRWLNHVLGWLKLDSISRDSAVPGLDREGAYQQQIPLPPLDEQQTIVHYLDAIDRRVRRYIRAKQRLLALLREQKQAIIHQAVTRGLDASAPLKPSGVAWLGEVPAHWEVLPVRRVIDFITSGSRGWATYYTDNGDLFVQSGNLGRSMDLDLRRVQRVDVPEGVEGERTRIQQDDVLICITGALTGNVVHVKEELPPAYINQHVALLRPIRTVVHPRYLAYTLYSRSGQEQLKQSEYGGTKQGLGLDDIRNVVVALPKLSEQAQIVLELDARLEHITSAIENLSQQIALIQEYRTRLIADVVTGKVDVRATAVALPAEAREEAAWAAGEGEEEGEEVGEEDGVLVEEA